jgi:uncharacterized membrane protein
VRRIRFLGHPIHPPLAHFPIAFLFLPFPLQAAAAWAHWPEGWRLAFYAEAVGLAAAVPAVITGLLDYASMQGEGPAGVGSPTGSKEKMEKALNKAGLHMLIMVGAACCFAADLIAGWFAHGVGTLILLHLMMTGIGLASLGVGGVLGADLVWRHGVGHEEIRLPEVEGDHAS